MRFFILFLVLAAPILAEEQRAYFAGGCFWCVEEAFEKVEGVSEVTSGFMGGTVPNPSYKQVTAGGTGHVETVEVRYDPAKVSYQHLLTTFWLNHDPTRNDGQFCDLGAIYRPVIFTSNEQELQAAQNSKQRLEQRGVLSQQVLTEISPASAFYRAEDYHQDYYKKNPLTYNYYKWKCGRQATIDSLGLRPADVE